MNDTQQTFQAGRRIDSQADEQVEPKLAPAKIVAQDGLRYESVVQSNLYCNCNNQYNILLPRDHLQNISMDF